MTSSPAATPTAAREVKRALVPLLVARQYRAPVASA